MDESNGTINIDTEESNGIADERLIEDEDGTIEAFIDDDNAIEAATANIDAVEGNGIVDDRSIEDVTDGMIEDSIDDDRAIEADGVMEDATDWLSKADTVKKHE